MEKDPRIKDFLNKVTQQLQVATGEETTKKKDLIEFTKGIWIEQDNLNIFEERLAKTGLLKSHRECQFKWTAKTKEIWDQCFKILSGGSAFFVFYGDRRSGKSQFCGEMFKRLVVNNFSCKYLHAQDLIDEISYSREKFDVISKYKKKYYLLVIDEFQRPAYTDLELRMLSGLVTYRFDDSRATIFISNFQKEKHEKILDQSAWTRLEQKEGMMVNFTGLNPVADLLFQTQD